MSKFDILSSTSTPYKDDMLYIKNMFKEANIDVEYVIKGYAETLKKGTHKTSCFCIKFEYGDEIDGFKYYRELCIFDCHYNSLEVIKIIENDIRLIKSDIRRIKLKYLGL
jgi:hypothetical protein